MGVFKLTVAPAFVKYEYVRPVVDPVVTAASVRSTVPGAQIAVGFVIATCGLGFTVIVNVLGVPLVQVTDPLVYLGVIVNVATRGVDPLLAAVNDNILFTEGSGEPRL